MAVTSSFSMTEAMEVSPATAFPSTLIIVAGFTNAAKLPSLSGAFTTKEGSLDSSIFDLF